MLLAGRIERLAEPRPVGSGAPVEHDMIDETVVTRIAGRRLARVGEGQIGVRRITIVDFGPDHIAGKREPAVPVSKHREAVGPGGAPIDPGFERRNLDWKSTRLNSSN